MTNTADAPPRSTGIAAGLLRSVRPPQWIKNVLVAAAPVAAGTITEDIGPVLLAFVAFTCAAAATYLLNDVVDREVDAAHPVKRHRPIAAGIVSVPLALTLAVVLAAVALVLPVIAGIGLLSAVLAVYLVTLTSYSLGLKHVPLVELMIVASGFVFRAVAGAVAADVPVSEWFLIVVSAGALHVATTKRFAELRRTTADGARGRAVLDGYAADVLAEIRYATVAIALAAYLLWAFAQAEGVGGPPWFQLSAVPFALALFRYSSAVHAGEGEAPEEVFLADRPILVYAAVWGVLFALAVYT